eukprot:s321_g28.t1
MSSGRPLPSQLESLLVNPDWITELQRNFDNFAATEREDEGPIAYVNTWYLHGTHARRCTTSRTARFGVDASLWQQQLAALWRDRIDTNQVLHLHWVEPRPMNLPGQSFIGHLILVQGQLPDFAAILLTAYLRDNDHDEIHRIAFYSIDRLPRSAAIDNFPIPAAIRRFPCHVRRGRHIWPFQGAPRVANGDNIIIEIDRRTYSDDDDGSDTLNFLQTHAEPRKTLVFPERLTDAAVAHAHRPGQTTQIPPLHPGISLDLTEAWQCFEAYDSAFLLPHFCLDAPLQSAWTEQWWDCQQPVEKVWIYHDGSHRNEGSGAAVAAFLYSPTTGWVFGGALSASFSASINSYGAELRSGILAIQFLIDILKIVSINQAFMPDVCLLHDNITVGAQLLGQWHALADVRAAALMRHLAVYCEHRFGVVIATAYVAAHAGDVGNELVDVLAGLAAESKPLQDLTEWFDSLLTPAFGQAAAWFWVLHCHHFHFWWHGTCLCLPAVASTHPSADVLPTTSSALTTTSKGCIDLIVGTCNVLTLRASAPAPALDVLTGISGPTRQHAIFRQFQDAKVCILALQETRLQRISSSVLDYMIFAGAATPQGHYGVLVALSTTLPYGTAVDASGREQKLFFQRSQITVISLSARWVILRVATPWIKFVIIGAHAPHSGQTISVIETWWADLERHLPPTLQEWPRLLLVDANAKVGSDTCAQIGDHGAELGGEKAEPFTNFVRTQNLWLPSTFHCHTGPSGTWRHSSGQWLRNDFVGLPTQWAVQTCRSWTSEDIDVSLHHEDHCAALVQFQFDAEPRGLHTKSIVPKNWTTSADLSALRMAPQPGYDVDVHSHAAMLQQQVLACLPEQPRGPVKLKYTMSEATWELVQSKRKWRNALHEAQVLQRQLLKQVIFTLWKASRAPIDLDFVPQFDHVLREQDRLIAHALHEFCSLGRIVTAAIRADDRLYFGRVLQEGADYLQPHQSRELWKVIKKALPKYQQRRQGVDPLRIMHLEDQWNPHFERLEAGRVTAPHDLVRAAHTCPIPADVPSSYWKEIPSLFELEQVLRSNKIGRATGNDPITSALWHNHPAILAEHSFALMIKMWVWGLEPIQYKGGPMALLLPKRPQPTEAQHYRGILLLPTLAKAFHALLRKRIIAFLNPIRSPGQLGGFHQQEVLFGSHALRLLGRMATSRHYSMGVLFVDLSTAFHCLVREMVVGIGSTDRLEFVLASLQRQGHPCEHLRLGQELPGLLIELGASPPLVRLLQNIHTHTWMTIGSHNYICTHKGTRPGSPLADAIFHFIMHDVALALRQFLDAEGHTDFLRSVFDVDLEPIIWSDDLAVPIVTAHCKDLIPALMALLTHVRTLFHNRGLVLNFAKGKAGVVATFCGPEAPAMRRTVQLIAQPGVHHAFADGDETFVHFSPAYRHLGTLYTSDQKLDAEISARIGAAASAFSQISRRILLNRHLPGQLRLQLFGSLILSKLYFGIGAWHTPTGRQLDRMRICIVRMVRKILRLPAGADGLPAAQVLVDAGLPEPRVRLAMDRLLYAQRLFHHGPAFLQHMIHVEAEQTSSWLAGLRHDLRWLYGVEAAPDERLRNEDHTDLIEFWQMGGRGWRGRIRRAGRRHVFQESIILEAQTWHAKIFAVLRDHAFTFNPDPALLHLQEGHYPCPDCDRVFTSPQGVHTHRRKVHDVYCPEHHLLDSATCPACLTFFWSTQRLQQHLAYMPRNGTPNPCFAYLQQIGYAVSYSAIALPSSVRGQSRLDALVVEGPHWSGPTASDRAIAQLLLEQQSLNAELAAYDVPEDVVGAGARLADVLTATTWQWFGEYCRAQFQVNGLPSLRDRWIDILCRLPETYESWASRTFLAWGEHLLPELQAEILDGEAERILEDAFADLAGDLHEYQLALRLRQVELGLDRLRGADLPGLLPHRPVRPPQKDSKPRSLPQLEVPRLFDTQERWHEDLRRVRWDGMPADPYVPVITNLTPRPTFLVVHLFSGRRRHSDLHAHLANWALRRNYALTILSLDTAVAPVLGNLDQRSATWEQLQTLYLQGRVAATISGHPCETFSSARWHPPPAELAHLRWPRPLRTALRLFGLDHHTQRELFQTKVGTVFWLQTVWVLACHLALGGLFLEEHPGKPTHEDHPSIWKSSIIQFFCRHPDIVLHHIMQWRFGAPTAKPTGLLALRCPHFGRDLYAHAVPGAQRPTSHAIGVDSSGSFRTACHKEYPAALSAALANVLAQQLHRVHVARQVRSAEVDADVKDWISDVAQVSSIIREQAAWLPDFQG